MIKNDTWHVVKYVSNSEIYLKRRNCDNTMVCKDLTFMTCLSKSCYLYGMQPRYAQLKKNLHRES